MCTNAGGGSGGGGGAARIGRANNISEITGNISYEQMMNATKNVSKIHIQKDVAVIPVSESGRWGITQSSTKGNLGSVLERNNINSAVVEVYRDRTGANGIKRMQDLGFEIQAQHKGTQQAGSSIPPTDYYYMKRTGTAKPVQKSTQSTKKTASKRQSTDNKPINPETTTQEQRRLARASRRQRRAAKYGRPLGSR